MKAVDFKGRTHLIQAPDCNDLPAYNDGQQTISCWEMDKDDFAAFLDGEKIYLAVLAGKSTPPVQLFIGPPAFLKDIQKGIDEANGPG